MKTIYTLITTILIVTLGYSQEYEFGIENTGANHFKIYAVPNFDSNAYGDADGTIDASDVGFTLVWPTGTGMTIVNKTDLFGNPWSFSVYDAAFITSQGLGDGTKDVAQFNLPPGQRLYSHSAGDIIDLVSFDITNMPSTGEIYIMLNTDPINVGAGNIFESFFNTALNTDNYDTQNYFTGLISGKESYDFSTAATNDLALVSFNYYPNPVKEILHVSAQENITQISIYNILGQEVINLIPTSTSKEINVSNLANGAYFIKAQVGDYSGTYKFIKQ